MHNIINRLLSMRNVSILVIFTIILTIGSMTFGEAFTNANYIIVLLLIFTAALYLVTSYRTRFNQSETRHSK